MALRIICGALITWAVYFSSNLDLRQLMPWMMGGFSGVNWRYGWLMLALMPVLLWLSGRVRVLNLLALVPWRNLLVMAISWLVGVSVAQAGAVGFIGLVIPHILWLNKLNDHLILLPGCPVPRWP